MKRTMTHEEIKSAFSELYNSFYLSHRCPADKKRTDEQWEMIVSESQKICVKYNSVMVRRMISALLEEFENEEREKNSKEC